MTYEVTIIETDGRCTAWCDDLPGCHSEGTNREEALENLRRAIRAALVAQPQLRTTFGARISRERLVIE